MSRRSENWVYGCLCVVFPFVFIFWMYSPIIAVLFLIIFLLTVAIIYVYRTQENDDSSNSTRDATSSIEEKTRPSIIDSVPKQRSHRTLDLDEPPPDSQISHSKPELELNNSKEELQKRIVELEKRVQLLTEELARDSISQNDRSIPSLDETDLHLEDFEENLSEKAIQHLLKSLDEKLAKRAISKQLYTRLHDKYIARLEKAKKRRKTFAKRGTKDSSTGDK